MNITHDDIKQIVKEAEHKGEELTTEEIVNKIMPPRAETIMRGGTTNKGTTR